MLIETERGQVETDTLRSAITRGDTETFFGEAIDFFFPDGVRAARFLRAGFLKVNPFSVETPERIMAEIEGVFVEIPTAGLEKKLGQKENADRFECWVEYWEPGAEKYLHRSVHVMIKRFTEAASGAAGGI